MEGWRWVGRSILVVVLLSQCAASSVEASGHGAAEAGVDGIAGEARRLRAERAGEAVLAPLMSQAELIAMGEDLFFNETFGGNGRTCGTCHRREDAFGLSLTSIATLPSSDPLFIAESNAGLGGLEHPPLMRSSRGLILENIDGFAQPPVFRNSPHLLNIAHTAPYGLSGEFADLREFTTGAVIQHFPLTLNRVEDTDFRVPTEDELIAMEAFMNSVVLPASQDFDLEDFVTTRQQRRGSDLFFSTARCFNCHNGPVLADSVAALGGGNRNFNTGVANLRINLENRPENPGGGALPQEVSGLREFNTPPLFGVSKTAPFFHDHSVATLDAAVRFYDSVEFITSPAAAEVGTIQLTEPEVADLVAFLESLEELPFAVSPRAIRFGPRDIAAGASAAVTVTLTELTANPVTVESAAFSGGPHDSQFSVVQTGPHTFDVTFDPASRGAKGASLEITTDAGIFGVELRGTGIVPGVQTFNDVPPSDPASPFVEAIFQAGLTGGCTEGPGGLEYCPDDPITRLQMAVFLILAQDKLDIPPRRRFDDVLPGQPGAGYVERLAKDGVTAGCGNGNFCPGGLVTRRQMAVFLVAASGRTPVASPTGVFGDVPAGDPTAGFIERLAADGITAGCGGGNYCPEAPVTRRQMAVLVARTFNLPLP
jgi:cytochrome c peroxidase